jgi:general stress protein 26
MADEQQSEAARLRMIVNEFRTAMLVNFASKGRIAARPMTVANRVGDGSGHRAATDRPPHRLSFVTRSDGRIAAELQRDASVCVTMQDGGRYVVMQGYAELSEDRERIRQLWNKAWDVWFEGGPDNPHVVLIDCDIEHAEFWDSAGVPGVEFKLELVPSQE